MSTADSSVSYHTLAVLVDHLLEKCEDNVICLCRMIDGLDSARRNELLVSDLLNAYQAFYYYFRIIPGELVCERLELEPASSLAFGVKIDEVDLLDLIFSVKDHEPLIMVSDGAHPLMTFKGKTAYTDGLNYIENPPY